MLCVQNKSVGNKALPSGRYPLCVAADYGQTDVIKYLIDNGADVNVSFRFSSNVLAYFELHSVFFSKIKMII